MSALATIAGRRLSLTIRTPRELAVPLLTPVLFAVVIAPALNNAVGASRPGGIDYEAFVATATVGLLVPLNAMLAGIGVIVDRDGGARRELLAAPVPRAYLVLGNLAVAVGVTAMQLAALLGAALLRGISLSATAGGALWAAAAALLLCVAMYGIAELLANRVERQEEYVGFTPAVAIVPWFFAGSLFPLGSLPVGLAAVAKVLPLTHALALVRYGLVDGRGGGLHDIWGMHDTTAMAALSLAVVAAYALASIGLAVVVFRRSAVR